MEDKETNPALEMLQRLFMLDPAATAKLVDNRVTFPPEVMTDDSGALSGVVVGEGAAGAPTVGLLGIVNGLTGDYVAAVYDAHGTLLGFRAELACDAVVLGSD